MALPANNLKVVLPNKQEAGLAEESSRILAAYMQSTKTPSIQLISHDGKKREVTVPAAALDLLVNILTQMAEGNAVTIIPVHSELTTQEAAGLLNVSRPYLIKLLDQKDIPYRKVGTRRKILVQDILSYKEHIDNERLKTLDDLAKLSQDLDMGYK